MAMRPKPSAEGALDPMALLAGLENDPSLRIEAEALLGAITSKLPTSALSGDTGLADDLDTLMSEALALVLGRLEREER